VVVKCLIGDDLDTAPKPRGQLTRVDPSCPRRDRSAALHYHHRKAGALREILALTVAQHIEGVGCRRRHAAGRRVGHEHPRIERIAEHGVNARRRADVIIGCKRGWARGKQRQRERREHGAEFPHSAFRIHISGSVCCGCCGPGHPSW
jgi:hypothetical protein